MIPATLAELAVPIETLHPYERNPRRGNLAAIKASLEAHGQYRPVVARKESGEVLAGNHTLAAALELGWTELAVTFVEVDDEQAARIVLVDNRTSDLGDYDDDDLVSLLSSLPELDGTGWERRELDRLLDEQLGEGADRDTEPGPLPASPKTRRGDLWRLGPHRLICGDSTSELDVLRLIDADPIEMVWTDPPYGVAYRRGAPMVGDRPEDTARLLEGSLRLAAGRTRPGGAIYLAHADLHRTIAEQALAAAGFELHQTLIWVKQAFVLGRQDYHWQHEPILYGWKPGAAHRYHGGFSQATLIDDDDITELDRRQLVAIVRQLQNERHTTVIREDRPIRDDLHPTMKPVALVARQIANSSLRGETVYDPFAGSGTTLIACENLGRHCHVVELEPGYCDVIIDRWERHTGGKAVMDAQAAAA